jgi:hypothetical protein
LAAIELPCRQLCALEIGDDKRGCSKEEDVIRRLFTPALILFAAAQLTTRAGTVITAQDAAPVTFHRDVEPILQKNCQTCHRPGQIAPMSFLTYQAARPWARAMKNAVLSKKMPPWFADPRYTHFSNDRSLAQRDIETIVAWVDAGGVEGNPQDAPAPVRWPENGWQIQPDVVVDLPPFNVPASGIVEWTNITIPNPFKEDTWVTAIMIQPDNVAVTHHIGLLFRPHTADTVYGVPRWEDIQRDEAGNAPPRRRPSPQELERQQAQAAQLPGGVAIEASYVPGMQFAEYGRLDAGKLIPASVDLDVQVHYTPNGKDVVDRPQVGFVLAKKEPKYRYISYAISAPSAAESFAIPPHAENWESPPAEATFEQDAELVWFSPHMHVRGKDMTYWLEYPDGRKETILHVPRYDFNWQLGYEVATPIKVSKGTKFVATAHYDNSTRNKFNPDPNRTVYYGNQTWEEMMQPFFGVIVRKDIDPRTVLRRRGTIPTGAD